MYICLLMSTVSIEESSADIDNLLSSPVHDKSLLRCNLSNRNSFKILLCRISKHLIYILPVYNNSHSLLGLRNRYLSSVKACILFRNLVKVDVKTIGKLTDCNRDTACTKVITFLNKKAYFTSSEQSLNLTLCRCITLLNLSSAGLNGSLCVNLG